MLPSKIHHMKVSHETGSEANFGFGPQTVKKKMDDASPLPSTIGKRVHLSLPAAILSK